MQHTEQIVDAARRLAAEKGEAFTTQELVKEAGVALQTFYRHFSGKDQLLLAVIEKTMVEGCANFEEQARPLRDPLDRLRFYVTVAIDTLDDEDTASRRFITAEHYRLHQLFPDQLVEATRPFRDLLETELGKAQAAGSLPPRDVARSAWFIAELVQATFHHYAFATVEQPIEEIAADLWQFCLSAIGGDTTSSPASGTARRKRPAPTTTE
ncbi:MAG TPA: helix-turn-helix domain-containing protein [Acidimicrobiales bacterium]